MTNESNPQLPTYAQTYSLWHPQCGRYQELEEVMAVVDEFREGRAEHALNELHSLYGQCSSRVDEYTNDRSNPEETAEDFLAAAMPLAYDASSLLGGTLANLSMHVECSCHRSAYRSRVLLDRLADDDRINPSLRLQARQLAMTIGGTVPEREDTVLQAARARCASHYEQQRVLA